MSHLLASAIFGPAFNDPDVAAELCDEAYFRSMLEVEAALARVQARLGLIPGAAAASIERAAAALELNDEELARGVLRDGVPTLALVKALRAAAGEAGAFAHLGATSQDIMDSATVLCVRRALVHMERRLRDVVGCAADLAEQHRDTLMVARTHGQQALPTTFGLKVAGWALPLSRHLLRLRELAPRLYVLQLGGAAGTLAALGPQALEIVRGVASELGLGEAPLPWHVQRDAVGELGAWLSLLASSLAKLALDVIWMSQSEVAEVSEAEPGERGGSSSMPQKNNPIRSEQIIAAARAVATDLAALHAGAIQEHERGAHGWQLEWLSLSSMLMLAAGALRNADELVAGLVVHPDRMRANLTAGSGLVLAEALVGALSAHMTRPAAQQLVQGCAQRALAESRSLIEVVRERAAPEPPAKADAGIAQLDWSALARPENYLGIAPVLVDGAITELRAALER